MSNLVCLFVCLFVFSAGSPSIKKLFHKLGEGSVIHFNQVQTIDVTYNFLFRKVILLHLWHSSVLVVTAHFIF